MSMLVFASSWYGRRKLHQSIFFALSPLSYAWNIPGYQQSVLSPIHQLNTIVASMSLPMPMCTWIIHQTVANANANYYINANADSAAFIVSLLIARLLQSKCWGQKQISISVANLNFSEGSVDRKNDTTSTCKRTCYWGPIYSGHAPLVYCTITAKHFLLAKPSIAGIQVLLTRERCCSTVASKSIIDHLDEPSLRNYEIESEY